MIRTTKPGQKKKRDTRLSEQEQLFCNLILENLNPTKKKKLYNYECYLKAYPKASVKTATMNASQLLRKEKIKKYIDKRKKAAAKRVEVKIADVLRGLLRIANFDIRKMYNSNGTIKRIVDLDDDIALGLAGIDYKHIQMKRNNKTIIKTLPRVIRTESRLAAWRAIGEHLNMFTNEVQQQTAEDFVKEVRDFATTVSNAVPGGKI